MNWRAELRAEGIDRRPSNGNAADRGYVEQPGEGTADKPPASIPRVPAHSRRVVDSSPVILRRPVTSLTPAPPSDRDIFPPAPPPLPPALLEEVKAAGERLAAKREALSLPPPSAEPTEPLKSEPASQNLVKLERAAKQEQQEERQACGKRARRAWAFPNEMRQKVLERFWELKAAGHRSPGGTTAEEFDISRSIISRWLAQREIEQLCAAGGGVTEMTKRQDMSKPKRSRRFFPQDVQTEAIGRVLTLGAKKGHSAQVAREMNIGPDGSLVSRWVKDHIAEHGRRLPKGYKAPANGPTLISSAPASMVQSKPNGAATSAPAPLSGFLTGLDEYIAQLVDARVEAKVREILQTKSLMELMRQ